MISISWSISSPPRRPRMPSDNRASAGSKMRVFRWATFFKRYASTIVGQSNILEDWEEGASLFPQLEDVALSNDRALLSNSIDSVATNWFQSRVTLSHCLARSYDLRNGQRNRSDKGCIRLLNARMGLGDVRIRERARIVQSDFQFGPLPL